MKYMVDPPRFAVHFAMAVILLAFAVMGAVYREWILCAFFAVGFAGFFALSMDFGSTVTLEKDAVVRTLPLPFLGRTVIPRGEVREVGVMGTNPFYARQGEKTGTKYLYLSPRKLSDEDRRQLAFHWTRDIVRLRFSKERYFQTQVFWDGDMTKYHIGDLDL